jgi:LDH2 family malate/lactate/ureidoglycolate dehydrogenase
MIDGIIASTGVRYPGQHAADIRRANLSEGVPVDADAWRFAQTCAGTR